MAEVKSLQTSSPVQIDLALVDSTDEDDYMAAWDVRPVTVKLTAIVTIDRPLLDSDYYSKGWNTRAQATDEVVPRPGWDVDVGLFASSSLLARGRFVLERIVTAPPELGLDPAPSVVFKAKDRTGAMRKVRVPLS